jgi:cyclohexyl-isocyanide hydratase
MNVAFVAFDGMTALDFVGTHDPVTRLSTMGYLDVTWDVCAPAPTVTASGDLRIEADRADEPLDGYDLVFVPGGFATRELRDDEAFVSWLRGADDADLLASVCTGSLLLGAAGFLDGKPATTHPSAYADLADYATVREDRVVDAGDVVTARGVSSSLDLGLYLVERLTDEATRREIAAQMDFEDRA